MTDKYILTGGPGSGKSSIILELESRGEHIVHEAAEDVIKRYHARGIERPWEMEDFQQEILETQIRREKAIPKKTKRAFIDRGIPDGLAYTDQSSRTAQSIREETPRYTSIFLIENLGQTQTNRVRHETQKESLEIEKKLEEIYRERGYEVKRIPPAPLQERTDRILRYIEYDAMTQPEMETRWRKRNG